jgi:hypothetical protein
MTFAKTLGADLVKLLADLPGDLGARAASLAQRFEAAFARPPFEMTIEQDEHSARVRCHRHGRTVVGVVESTNEICVTAEVLAEMAESLAHSARPAPCRCLPRSGRLTVVLWDPTGGHFAFSDGVVTAACSVQENPLRN